jgi:hypothetical protein
MNGRAGAPPIRFKAALQRVDKSTIVRLPGQASRALPSRGQVAVQGTIDGHPFETVVEPDGNSGHWIRIEGKLEKAAGVKAGQSATLEIHPVKEWPEPDLPPDFQKALATAPKKIRDVWKDITPMARWEWVRWVNATSNADTRKRRVEVTISKMDSGKRRPCCFNLAACTDPHLSRNGRLLDAGPSATRPVM